MGTSYNPSIVTDGLVLCLDAANPRSYPKSGTTWSDLAGSNNGTLVNGPTFDAGNGGSVVFDGSDDRVDCTSPSEIDSISEITMIAWVRYSGIGYYPKIMSRGHQAATDFTRGNSNNELNFYYSSGNKTADSDYFTTTTGSINLSSGWICVAVTSGSVVKFYKNSDLVYTSGSVTTNTGTGSTLVLGNKPGGGRNFNGRMGVAMVYNRVLTAAEIRQNYEATAGRYS
jgi:hypothetical protein